MPELPEIETLARGLRSAVVGKTIADIIVTDPLNKKSFKADPKALERHVIGAKIAQIDRRAKWLIIRLSRKRGKKYNFVVHLKMTGQLLFVDAKGPHFLGGHSMSGGTLKDLPADALKHSEAPEYPNTHTRVYFVFKDGGRLFYQDMRKFGYVELYEESETEEYFRKKKLGREPIAEDYTLEYFKQQLQRRNRTTIKAALLDQSTIAGIGNIYADDALWMAKINPERRVGSLTQVEQKALHRATTKVLQQAIDSGGTSFSDFFQVDGTLGKYWKKRKVYQRNGKPCKRCKTTIQKTRVAGRGTHFCPNCQL